MDLAATDDNMSDDALHALSCCPTQTAAAALGGLLRAGGSWPLGHDGALTSLTAATALSQCSACSKAELFDVVVYVHCQL
jgi:hypothetical protein